MSLYDSALDEAGDAGGPRLTGWKVLGILVAFFGVVAAVDGVMVYAAVSTFRGETEAKPYEHGLAYNREIARARAQAQRDWRVEAKLARGANGAETLRLALRETAGAPVTGVAMQAVFASPADKKQDVEIALKETAPGRFEGEAIVAPGWRDLTLIATRAGEEVYRSKSRLRIGAAP